MATSFLASSLFLGFGPEQEGFQANALASSHSSHTKKKKVRSKKSYRKSSRYRSSAKSKRRYKYSKRRRRHKKRRVVKKAAPKPIKPQLYIPHLNKLTLKPGLVFRYYRGSLVINVAEVDMRRNNLAVRPYLASQNFDRLKTVKQHASESGALVTVNANYFKKDGTPLGAIKMDGEWISGSLFNRVAMGITRDKDVLFAPVNLHGILETSNPKAKSLWVNNMNQPRINGARMILYTHRWGNSVTLPYEGKLVAVNQHGEVVDTHSRAMRIPYKGYVLTDRKESKLGHLAKGDLVHLTWHTAPKNWNRVEHAISGGPTLVKNGRLYVGLKQERFRLSWTSSKITHRTACGFTRDKKLILATVEGPHNMWDLAKFMHQLGCVDAMNLDGGGSTTMVVNGTTVTRNGNGKMIDRKVAATLVVMDPYRANQLARTPDRRYHPKVDLTKLTIGPTLVDHLKPVQGSHFAKLQHEELDLLTGHKVSNFEESDLSSEPNVKTEKSKSTVVFRGNKVDQVIDIDDDLTEGSEKEENKRLKTFKKNQKSKLKKMQKEASQNKETPGWSKKILKPFSFKKKEG